MPKLIPMIAVVVHRDGKAIRLNPNDKKVFDFTEDEVKDILAFDPDALREPVNETTSTTKAPAGKPKAPAVETKAEDM